MHELEYNIQQLNRLIINGETIKAIELFYADDVIVQENEENPRLGKQTCLDLERKNIDKIAHVSSQLLNQAIDFKNSVVFSEWEITFITKLQEKFKLTEVAVQKWNKGKIYNEKFYYKEIVVVR